MPGKGKHRRTRTSPLTRGFVAAGTGGAAIALPLLGAAGAHAAERPASATAQVTKAPAAAPVAEKAAEKSAAVYRVVAGDHLSKIADEQRVDGGWQRLYEDNRKVVGGDPALIHPGVELAIAKATGGAVPSQRTEATPEPASRSAAPATPEVEPAPAAAAPAESDGASQTASDTAETPAAPAAAGSGYTTPLESGGVTTSYRASGAMWSSGYHTGVDFAAATGTTVRSVGPGSVVSAGWSGSYGNEVVIQHTDGTYSQYAHLSSLAVSAGQSVTGGQQIGLSGSTGNSSGPHLHFEIRTGPDYGSDIDPVAYLRQHGVSL
ncbi:peptidoglycan DD-metalloendopeptidase family protein [Streptomyces sp. NPDC020965]|uniref:M23 family metallopeptidase n=1 Tax=Streptomyces sp. NPDC020965 TaxID=3365105 RepID=UPI0037AC6DF6